MKITIIEDDINLSENLAKKLIKNGYNTSIFNNKNEILENHKIESDLYIIDLNL
jgi:DNA-binding response OmpR family regulator